MYFSIPALLLILYTIKRFRSCLSMCHINFITIHIFTDKVYSCYRDGLDGGRDMRSFSGLYFFLRIAAYICALLSLLAILYLHINHWLSIGILLFFMTLTVTITKPYRKAYMNYCDIAILSHLAIFFCVLSSGRHAPLLARTLVNIPILIFVLVIISKKGYDICLMLLLYLFERM